jgi:hypothetical protein
VVGKCPEHEESANCAVVRTEDVPLGTVTLSDTAINADGRSATNISGGLMMVTIARNVNATINDLATTSINLNIASD